MLVLFSKLLIAEADQSWIESIRRLHDPQITFVEPHFTFVFPFTGIPEQVVSTHAAEIAKTTDAISFRLTQAVAAHDPFRPRSHLFLLPTEGVDPMHALHARLYSGPLAARLEPNIPFVPHVTIGVFEAHEAAEDAAASLGPIDIRGSLEGLELVEFDGASIVERGRYPFRPQP